MTKDTITSISVIAAAALGAALVGVLGAYVVLPEVAPSVAADGSARDSTKQAVSARDSTADQMSEPASGAMGDSTAQGEMTEARGDEKRMANEESPMAEDTTGSSAEERLRALQDSIDTLNRRLQDTQETADTLRSNLADADAEQAKVNELSDALMEMRQRNLGNLLKDVDMSVLKKLYNETSGGARTRLLQSMPPAQAAQFVNQVVEEDAQSASRSESGS